MIWLWKYSTWLNYRDDIECELNAPPVAGDSLLLPIPRPLCNSDFNYQRIVRGILRLNRVELMATYMRMAMGYSSSATRTRVIARPVILIPENSALDCNVISCLHSPIFLFRPPAAANPQPLCAIKISTIYGCFLLPAADHMRLNTSCN